MAKARKAAVEQGDPNAGLPTEWAGSRPTPTGRRKSSIPVIEIARAETKDEAMAGLERWKARHPDIVKYFEPADILVDGMRGRSALWYRIRVNLIHVPEGQAARAGTARVRLRPVGRAGHRGLEGGDGGAPCPSGRAEDEAPTKVTADCPGSATARR